ncbi:MAG: hydroxymethylbilane synthase [Actinomycetia bacterium]|nr:hydroxymethylbilane synthase [Actinomycetes bacterium]
MTGPVPLRVATRGSRLARWQAQRVVELLDTPAELVVIATEGDRRTDVPIHELGGTGIFVKEVQAAVLDGRADVAVHSAKDLPSETPTGLVLAAVPERADRRDALIGSSLAALPQGARVGTGAVRRRAQLAHIRPDLEFGELRGNLDTRLARASEYDAVVVAIAALQRLQLEPDEMHPLDFAVMLPQVAQGALAVECRADDPRALEALACIDALAIHREVAAERAFLGAIGGGCSLPCGALARTVADGALVLDVLLASLDGATVLRELVAGAVDETPADLGARAGRVLLEEHGGAALLRELRP